MHAIAGHRSSLLKNPRAKTLFVYLTGTGFVISAFALRSLLQPLIGEGALFILFYTAIMVAAWQGGFRVGLLATVGAILLQLYASLAVEMFSATEGFRLILFALEGVLVSGMVDRLQVARRQTVEAQERLQLALNAARISLYTNDRDLKYTWISGVHPKFGPPDIIGKRDEELLPAASVAGLIALKQQVMATGQRQQQYIHTTIYDESFSFFVVANPIITPKDGITGVTVAAVDVTEVARLQLALDEQRYFTDTILRTMPAVTYVFDVEKMQNRFVNDYAAEVLGYTPDEIIAAGPTFFSSIIHPDDQPAVHANIARLLNADPVEPAPSVSVEYRMRHKSGQWLWFAGEDVVFRRDRAGAVREILGIAWDVTARKQSEEKYRTLFNSIDEGFCICEILVDASEQPRDYRFLETNPMFEPHTGLKDAPGKTALELVPDLEQHWVDIYGKVALTGEPVRFIQGSDAMGRWFDTYSFRFGDPEKRQFAILFTDISARRQAEEALRQQKVILQQLVEHLPIMITIYEPDAQVLYLNHEFERLTGWSTEAAAQVDLMTELYPDADYRQAAFDYMQSLTPGWRTIAMTARDGSIIDSSWANIRLSDGQQVGIGLDIRERLRNEKRNDILRTVAAALSKALSPREVTEISLKKAIAPLGAAAGTVVILSPDGQQLEIVGTYGYPDQVVDKWHSIPLDHPTAPIALAVREERALWMRSPEERQQIIPLTPDLTPDEQHQAWAVLPFNVDNQLKGAFGLGFASQQVFHDAEQTFLLTLTDTCAQAMARAYLSEKLREAAATEERHRLSRDLHDAVKQLLFASSAMSDSLPRVLERKPARAQELAVQINRLNRAALAEMQILLQTMRPETLIRTSFNTLLENLCEGLKGRKQIEVDLAWSGPDEFYLPEKVHTELYRLAQEAFNNIARHSEASLVNVVGTWHQPTFELIIRDDGQGFDLKRISIGLGMNTMRERAVAVGAEFNISSAPGAGTQVSIRWQGEPG